MTEFELWLLCCGAAFLSLVIVDLAKYFIEHSVYWRRTRR